MYSLFKYLHLWSIYVYLSIMALVEPLTNGGDAPIRVPGQPGETSSLGLFWPPKETDFHRVKAFYPRAVLSEETFAPLNTRYMQRTQSRRFTTEGMEETGKPEDGVNVSRVTFRAVVSDEFLRTHNELLRKDVEGIIPLEGMGEGSPFAGTSLVYFGRNHVNRKSDENTTLSCVENLRTALAEPERTPDEMIQKAVKNGYELTIVRKDCEYTVNDTTAQQLFQLYEPFGWSREQVVELLNAPNRMLSVATKEGSIVSAGIAEIASQNIHFSSDVSANLRMIELTDAATLIAHEGKGLYSAVSTVLLQELAIQAQNTNDELIVFGESNASALGVLKTASHQGRTFASEVGGSFGYQESGMLHQHVPILDRGEKIQEARDRYNNFYPTFINKSKLIQKYGHAQ